MLLHSMLLVFRFWKELSYTYYAVRSCEIKTVGIKEPLMEGTISGPPRKTISRNCPVRTFECVLQGTTVLHGLDGFLEMIASLLRNHQPNDPEQGDNN